MISTNRKCPQGNVVFSIIYNNIKYNPVYETPALYYGFECWEMKKLVDKMSVVEINMLRWMNGKK